ncbi:MAG TPA: GIY-YIG nuclease family protein [bacterium]|nr:GIY-YIG nuclease family protein [bacterium]
MLHLRDILDTLPQCPGVYIYRDAKKRIIYVGKSVNLRSRVNSYFRPKTELSFAKHAMVEAIADIEYIETRNETEALVLETNLIKEHRPKYNILMKDDKNLAYIKITNDPIPELVRVRRKTVDGIYFGPYTAGVSTTDLIRSLRRAFRVRACRMKFAESGGKLRVTAKAGRSIPCLDHYIGLCPAPCTLEPIKIAEHEQNFEELRDFMRGGSMRKRVIREMTDRMAVFAERRQYEEAARLRDEIRSLEGLSERQIVRDMISEDADVVVLLPKYDRLFAGVAEVRGGELVSVRRMTVENP